MASVHPYDDPIGGETTVRRLTSTDEDLEAIVAQINAAEMEIGKPFTVESLGRFVTDNRNIYLVAHIDGELAGTLHAIYYDHPNGEGYVYVDEVDTAVPFRRRGVATRLMDEVRRITRGMGASEAWLGADEGNDAAHALYRKLGPSEAEPGVVYSYTV